MKEKIRIAILGDFPIGNEFKQYSYPAHFYPSWLFCLYEALATESKFDILRIVISTSIKAKEVLIACNQIFHLLPGSSQISELVTAYLHDRYAVCVCSKELKSDILHAWGKVFFCALTAKDYKALMSVQKRLKTYRKRTVFSCFLKQQSLYEPVTI